MGPRTKYRVYLVFFLLFTLFEKSVWTQMLNPPYFNLAEGRNISATATCGENVPDKELYCKLVGSNWLDSSDDVNLIEGQACDFCDPADPKKAHPAQYAIDGTERWWQSPPLSRGLEYSQVNLTIDLGQEFHVAYVFIKMGNSPRPGVWVLERSRDYGKTYTPWQYFADTPTDCIQNFGKLSVEQIARDDSVICETKFSKLVPLEGGEIAISLLNGRPSADNFSISATLQEWSTATNIRLRFVRPKTTLGHLITVNRQQDETVTRRYFYSIKDINIGGRCVCNGHASQCDQISPLDPYKVSCSCQHNTCGTQCEQCCPGYQQYEWSRATLNDPFVCEKCNCNGHSEDCYYDPEVASKNQSMNIHGTYVGGGVCRNCQHNTTGINCHQCKDYFYRPFNKPIDAIDVCQPCKCDLRFSTGKCFEGSGVCECRPNYQAPDCDKCSYGYYGFPECKECDCYRNGTYNNVCELTTGDCPCKEGYGGSFCKNCSANYFGFPNCQPCECDPSNSIDNNCNLSNGQCNCKTNFGGRKCDQCSVGYFNYPRCEFCLCERVGSTEQICDRETGQCICKPGYSGPSCSQCAEGYFGYPNCTKCECNPEGSSSSTCDKSGRCQCKFNYGGLKCGDCSPGYYNFPKCVPCNCNWVGSHGNGCDHSSNCVCKDRFEGAKCDKCKEGYYNFPTCEECNCNPAGLVAEFGGCDKMEEGKLCECKSKVKGRICNQCKDLYWNLQLNNPNGCEDCLCNTNGTISRIGLCDSETGQCMCKPNVQGRTCSSCKRNTYRLESSNLFGCIDCNCDVGGSIGTDCDALSGQCRCRPRITGRNCSKTIESTYFPTLYQFLYEAEDWFNPTGSQARFGYDEELFPGYSWRGYATFNNLQKEIFTNLSISKFSIYRVIVNYVNLNNDPVNAVLSFTPNEWMNEEEQAISIVFEPSKDPRRLLVTGKQLSSRTVALVAGPWRVSLKADKPDLYVDYVVLLPQPYYDQSLFHDQRSEPCKLLFNQSSCIKYAYPSYPEKSDNLKAFEAFSLIGDEEVKPETVDLPLYGEKLKLTEPMVKVDEKRNNLLFDFKSEDNSSYLLLLNYHTPNNHEFPIKIDIEFLDSERNVTIHSDNLLTACPYLLVCRQIVTTNNGQMLLLDLLKDRPYKLKLSLNDNNVEGVDLNIDSIVLVPFSSKWSFDYVKPKFVCILQDGKCANLEFPTTTEGVKIEAEVDTNRDRAIEEPVYKENVLSVNQRQPVMVKINSSNQIDLRGTVPEPGSYAFVLHYYQPKGAGFVIEALIQDDQFYSGVGAIEHCANVAGCRSTLWQRETNSSFFFIQKNFMLTLRAPSDSEMYLDYLLIIPGNSFKEQMLSLSNTDVGSNLMIDCLQNNYYVDPDRANDHCRASIFSITVDFNGGALPCQCNIDGSFDHKCKSFGGQCKCKPNVIGRECSMCKTGYYGFPNCRKCNCPSTAICHAKTGDCICPRGVTGENCDKCLPFTFGFDKIIGCVDCACNPHGVQNRDLNCDLETGNCNCKRNIVGRTCNKCKAGFFSFPECQLCRCDIRGTTEEICDQRTARCFCKKNVDGIYCDRCKADSYYLEESNQLGCSKCFCFGTTDRCTSSSLHFTQAPIVNKEWEIYNLTFVDSTINAKLLTKNNDYGYDYAEGKFFITTNVLREIETHTTKDDMQSFDSTFYISLPKEFLGNKITSYGGRFQYKITNKHVTDEALISLVSPDLILIGKNTTLIHQHEEQPIIKEEFLFSIRLLEKEFRNPDGRLVTREQLMITLVELNAIYIRLKYFDPISEIVLRDVQMDVIFKGNRITGAPKALSVEQCNCPPNYKGTSCEECAEGYYRVKRGPYLGTCVPCNCNGHSNECDPVTGKCFNCKYNTEGDQCERCIVGYHGDATKGTPYDCIICACPLPIASNNFATACDVSPSGSVLNCICKEGYNGTRCDYCAAGHYGQPQIAGRVCKKCECNNNIDVFDPESCDSTTGVCLKCLNNATGDQCERCAMWNYGDSVNAKNCTACACNQCGSENCDHITGDCKCKSNVVGKLCDKCASGHYGFSSCTGCKGCKCHEGAYGHDCNEDGQCQCKPGVAGKHCETCQAGYWGYTKYGCTSCKCNEKFSRVTQCNLFTGQCQCLPGVIGEKCERCPDRWVLVPETGCQECGNCVHVLLNDIDELHSLIDPIQNDIQSTSSSVLEYIKLAYVKAKHKNYTELFNKTFDDTPERRRRLEEFTQTKKDLNELSDNIEKLDLKSDAIEKSLIKTNQKALAAHNESINVDNQVKLVKQAAVQVVENINLLENSYLNTSTMQNLEQKSKEAEQIVEEMRKSNLTELAASPKIEMFNDTLDNAHAFVKPSIELKTNIQSISTKLYNMTTLVSELKNLTQKARENTINAEKIFKGKLKQEIEDKVRSIEDNVKQIGNLDKDAYKMNNDSRDGYRTLEAMSIDIDQQRQKLQIESDRLKVNMEQKSNTFPNVSQIVEEAKSHSKQLKIQSNYLGELFASTRDMATDPLRAANAYNNISSDVNESERIIKEITKNINIFDDLADKQLLEEVRKTQDNAIETVDKVKQLANKHADQSEVVSSLTNGSQAQANLFKDVNNKLNSIDIGSTDFSKIDNIKSLVNNATSLTSKVATLLDSVEQLRSRTASMKRYTDFISNVNEGKEYISRFKKDTASVSVMDAKKFQEQENQFKMMKDSISDKIAELKRRIQLVKHNANNIRVGANFKANSVLELNNPPNLAESSTYTKFSMQFLPRTPNGLLAYIGNPTQDGSSNLEKKKRDAYEEVSAQKKQRNIDYVCLELIDGKVTLTWDLGLGTTGQLVDEKSVNPANWCQVTVERFGMLFNLSVQSDSGGTISRSSKLSQGRASVFNLDPRVSRIFIGGIPDEVKIDSKIVNRHYEGLISNVILDNEPLGLWNLKKVLNVEGAVPNKLSSENSLRFNGNSYVILPRGNIDFSETVHVNFSFKTFVKNGLLFLIGDPNVNEYLSIEMNNGKIVLRYELGSAPVQVISTNSYNDGKWHFVKVNREAKESLLMVDETDEQTGFGVGMSTGLSTDDNIYIGGYPGLRPYYDVTKGDFDGCIRDLQIGTDQQNLNNNKESFGISSGCSTDFVRTVSFVEQVGGSKGYVRHQIQSDSILPSMSLTFKFRTLSKMGLLVHLTNPQSSVYFSIYLLDGMLALKSSREEVVRTDNLFYNDNQWHYITVELTTKNLKLDIDDTNSFETSTVDRIDFSTLSDLSLFVGGLSSSLLEQFGGQFGDFIGCIGDITLNAKYLNFADAQDKFNVQFTKCPLVPSDQEFSLSSIRKIIETNEASTPSPSQQHLPPIGNCKLPPIPFDASRTNLQLEEVRFGDTLWSRYEFSISNDVSKGLENESGFQITFKTIQANGVVFYITSSNNIDFVGLYFINNKLHYGFDCGSGRGVVTLQSNYSDGQWHVATFSRKGRNGLLRVDDETAEMTSLGSTSSLNVKSPIYVGGVPEELSSQVKGHLKSLEHYTHAVSSFSGCLKDLKVRDLEYKFKDGRGVNVASCSDQVEYGHFFHHEGGYVRLFEEFRVGLELTLQLQVKPRKPDGILVAVFGKTDFLVLYMNKGNVVFAVDNGKNPIVAEKNMNDVLCDGNWHTIKAVKAKNIIMLTVDDTETVIGMGFAGISSTDTSDPLFIGGLPAKLKEEKKTQLNSVTDDYLGCMRINEINNATPSMQSVKIEGHITLNSCPTV